MELLIGFWIVCGVVGAVIAGQKNAAGAGFFLGLLLGPLGVIAAFAMDNRATCPHCNSRLNGTPKICPQCHREVSPVRTGDRSEGDGSFAVRCAKCKAEVSASIDDTGQPMKCPACGKPSHVQLFRR